MYVKLRSVQEEAKGLTTHGMNTYKIKKRVFTFFSIKLFFKNLLFISYYKFSVN